MNQQEVAYILDEIGTLLELHGENPFRCQAYHQAARAVSQLQSSLAELVATGQLTTVRGLGATLAEKITQLVTTGRLPFYEELKARTPPGLLQLLRVPGLGPKKVKALYEQLGIDSLDKLQLACEQGRVARLKGFGIKTQEKILEGIRFLGQGSGRVRLDQALAIAGELEAELRRVSGLRQLAVCGSLRRRKETIRDIDLLATARDSSALLERFVQLPGVVQVLAQGPTKSSVVVERVSANGRPCRIQADLRVVSDDQYPFALHYFTGSKEHCVAMRTRAQQFGLKLNEYELAGPDRRVTCREEADIFRALDLDYIPPELREDTGELEAAARHALPRLIEAGDLRGTFHCHTTASDGADTLEAMAEAARAAGLSYLGIADHSQSLTVAGGLSPARVRRQQVEIDRLNRHWTDFRLFKGTEVDILADGRLDYDDDLLASFDYVVASVHTHFGQSEQDMTARLVRAIEHPRVTMLGHVTGRLLLQREGYRVDLEAVLQAAARTGTLLEINANPYRLELDWIGCKRAKALGVQVVINPDAHSCDELENLRFGLDVARRGWLEKEDVFNTRTLTEVSRLFAAGGKVSSRTRH